MNNIMNNLRRFMYGRYGLDQFSRGLVILSLILSIAASFSRVFLLILIAYIPFVYAVVRILSKNYPRRNRENQLYCRMMDDIKKKFSSLKLSLVGTKTHKYYKCTRCKQSIRVPRGKGKICITCPKCRNEFVRRT